MLKTRDKNNDGVCKLSRHGKEGWMGENPTKTKNICNRTNAKGKGDKGEEVTLCQRKLWTRRSEMCENNGCQQITAICGRNGENNNSNNIWILEGKTPRRTWEGKRRIEDEKRSDNLTKCEKCKDESKPQKLESMPSLKSKSYGDE